VSGSFLRFLREVGSFLGCGSWGRRSALGGFLRQTHVGLKRLVSGLHHANDDLEIILSLDFIQLYIFVFQSVLNPLLETAREGNIHLFQPPV
jgi:hypothetical protein